MRRGRHAITQPQPLGPSGRAGLRAPVGVVVKPAVKLVSSLSSRVLEITQRLIKTRRGENCCYCCCPLLVLFPKTLSLCCETEIGAFIVIYKHISGSAVSVADLFEL